MPEGAIINIRLQVKGKTELQRLNSEIAQLDKALKKQENHYKIADRQQERYTKRLRLSNKIMQEKVTGDQQHFKDIAKELNLQQDLNDQYEGKIEVERRVLRAKEDATAKGIKFNSASARSTIENAVKEEMAYQRVQASINAKRKSLMQASISLFVMNISLNQLVSSIAPLVKGNEDATQSVKEYQAMLNMTLGPMQVYMAFQQMSINLSKEQALAVKGALASMTMLFLIYKALTVKSKALKLAFVGLAVILGILTMKAISQTIATMMEAVSFATLKAVVGDMSGFMKVALGLGIMGLAVGLIGAMAGFQTPIGGTKRVGNTGLAMVHEGEVFGRPSQSIMNQSSNMVFNMNFAPGTSRDDADYIARTVNNAIVRGRGSKTSGGVSLG